MGQASQHPCPCWGYLVFDEPPGSYDICPICFWEDDIYQLRFASRGGGANHVSLLEGQKNYLSFGACEQRMKEFVRPPLPNEQRDRKWRMLDPDQDAIEIQIPGVNYGASYPDDPWSLYYWSPTYWRRVMRPVEKSPEQQTSSSNEETI